MKAADLLANCLVNEGTKYVFGIPGEEVLDVVEALDRSSIKFITTAHEQGAAFMANGYARYSGDAGLCLATLGPGATNTLTGVADAFSDHVPLIAITGQASLDRIHKESHQYIDIVRIFEPVTRYAARITTPDIIPEVVRRSFRLARTEKPSACLIEVPEDIASATTNASPMPVRRFRRPSPDSEALKSAAKIINSAKFPVLLLGNGAVRKPASLELTNLVMKAGIPATMTFMGKGAISEGLDYALPPIGLRHGDLATSCLEMADVVVAVGYDQVEFAPRAWNYGNSKQIVHIDFTPAEIDQSYEPRVEVIADIRETIEKLTALIDRTPMPSAREMCIKTRSHLMELDKQSISAQSFPIDAGAVLHILRKHLAVDDVVVSDVGTHKLWIALRYPAYAPKSVIISNGLASMGIGVPGAIGVRLAKPSGKVVTVVGDGGFLMTGNELKVAASLGLDLKVIIMADGQLGMIAEHEQRRFGRQFAVDLGNVDYESICRALGVRAWTVDNTTEFERVLQEALATTDPCAIVVPVKYSTLI
jgi:acetolactate synthase-1/2/3 large subunit